MAEEQQESLLIDGLKTVLKPLGAERAAQLIKLARGEIKTRPLIAFVEARDGTVWTLGDKSPVDKDSTVFALVLDEPLRAVAAFCFKEVEYQGQAAITYWREWIFDLKNAQGPISGEALYDELVEFLSDPPEPAPGDGDGDGDDGDDPRERVNGRA